MSPLYERASFTVPVSTAKPREDCTHGWRDVKGRCMWCGDHDPAASLESVEASPADNRIALNPDAPLEPTPNDVLRRAYPATSNGELRDQSDPYMWMKDGSLYVTGAVHPLDRVPEAEVVSISTVTPRPDAIGPQTGV